MRHIALLTACIALLIPHSVHAQGDRSGRSLESMTRGGRRPRLVVVISIDQFRPDIIARLTDQFLPATSGGGLGGFRYLLDYGSYYLDARYQHFPLETGPGHAVILTGGNPCKTGIVANDWWDRRSNSAMYCVADSAQRVVGARPISRARPMGPRNLRSTTVGDELKAATGGAARVVSIAVKDRAAILLGGHAADVAIWFDESAGNWISSTAYCRTGSLPTWVDEINRQEIPESILGTDWTTTLSQDVVARSQYRSEPAYPSYGMGEAFPHRIGSERSSTNYRAFRLTPASNRYALETARQAVIAERLGEDDTPDLLAISLSANDYAGHAFGINSPEVFDVTIETDRYLAAFFDFLHTRMRNGLDDVVIALTADHGASMIPESASVMGISAGRIYRRDIMRAAHNALSSNFGAGEWLASKGTYDIDSIDVEITRGGYIDPYLYLNDAEVARAISGGRASSRAQIEQVAASSIASIDGIYACYTRTQIMNGMLPPVDISRSVSNAFHPKVSGDVMVVTEQSFVLLDRPKQYTSSHGSPYSYDAHVPLILAGAGVSAGVHTRRVAPTDLAPTLSALLGIEFPSGCDGEILHEAVRQAKVER